MMKQHGKVIIITVFFLFLTGNNVFADTNKSTDSTKGEYLYPANKEKVFTETVDQFYEALRKRSYPVHQEFYKKHYEFYKKHKNKMGNMDTALFKDMPDASVNFRKKVLFHEVERFKYITWDGNGILTSYPDIQIKFNQAVSPYRQVYFFYSFKDTDKDFYGRCAVFDVETKKLVAGGDVYIDKYLKPRK
ncbi:hypothetical protein E2K98_24970 [Bacillus salipaludis]|uniref:Uncharacterized protein n=1 Tax=Bacillus salipaludis TaxID=2547811 RepID=A0A4R5VJW1_9BACI|nr:hypothetical protein [Bacillus salipaludis]TDK58171.1 hypothetical protein E2K98_24970 [Bacillus salipaludis]